MPERGSSSVPSILLPLSTDEYNAPPRTPAQRLAIPLARYVESRRGTAAGLLAMNASVGGTRYFEVPPAP